MSLFCRFRGLGSCFFNDTATTEIYTLSLHGALPIFLPTRTARTGSALTWEGRLNMRNARFARDDRPLGEDCPCPACARSSEEHTSELQSRQYLVCRLLLAQKLWEQRLSMR